MKRSVYIGTEGEQELAAHVLRSTIELTCNGSVDVHFLNRAMLDAGYDVDNSANSNTPFSKQRIFVPALARTGQAAYLDSDMVIFRNINDLFDAAGSNAIATCKTRQLGRDPQSAVTVFYVDKCDWDPDEVVREIDREPSKYMPYLYEYQFAGGNQRCVPAVWNDLEHYDAASTCLLHYTDMETQPWLTTANSLADVWVTCLRHGMEARLISGDIVESAVKEFQVRPSLLWQAKNNWVKTVDVPLPQRLKDVLFFIPPYSLVDGIPLGVGALVSRVLKMRCPRLFKHGLLLVCGLILLARKRRRVLVSAALRGKCCVINRREERVLS
jgi:hypothetical protein